MTLRRGTSRRALLRNAAAGIAAAPVLFAADRNSDAPRRHAPLATAPGSRRSRRYVDGPYGQIHVTSTAPATGRASRPPVICLPMSPRSGRDFDDFAARLADERWVHCPDVPGFGGSDAPPAPPSIEDYAQALIEGLRQIEPARRRQAFDLVGQHTGGAMGIEIARRAPALVRRLVLIGVPLFTDDEREKLRAQFVKPRPYFDDPDFLAKAWQRELPSLAAGLSRERMLLRFTEIMRAGQTSFWGFRAVFEYPMRERLAGVSQPLLSIVLNENLGAASREAARLVQRGEVREMPDLPGAALDMASERLADVAAEFFNRA